MIIVSQDIKLDQINTESHFDISHFNLQLTLSIRNVSYSFYVFCSNLKICLLSNFSNIFHSSISYHEFKIIIIPQPMFIFFINMLNLVKKYTFMKDTCTSYNIFKFLVLPLLRSRVSMFAMGARVNGFKIRTCCNPDKIIFAETQ